LKDLGINGSLRRGRVWTTFILFRTVINKLCKHSKNLEVSVSFRMFSK